MITPMADKMKMLAGRTPGALVRHHGGVCAGFDMH